jgi:plasmid stability protein
MSETTRATIYLDSDLHRALRLKAASTHRSVSDLVAEAVREALREDREDLASARSRAAQPSMAYEMFLKKLKADRKV